MPEQNLDSLRKAPPRELNRDQLIARLRLAESKPVHDVCSATQEKWEQVVHELQVYQVELEMQNRQLQESQQMLEESRSKYADLYEYCPAGLMTLDIAGHIKQINSTAVEILGREKDTIVGFSIAPYLVPSERSAFLRGLRRCLGLRDAARFNAIVAFVGRSGVKKMHVAMRPATAFDQQGSGVSVSLVDVSAQVALNEQVGFLAAIGEQFGKTLEQKSLTSAILSMAVPSLADLALIHHVGGGIQNTNSLTDDNWRCWGQMWPEQESHPIAAALNCIPFVEKFKKQSGPLRWSLQSNDLDLDSQQISVLRIGNADAVEVWPLGRRGEVLAVLVLVWSANKERQSLATSSVIHDFVHRAALSLENVSLYRLAQAQIKTRNDFLAIVAHDLRNPLTVIGIRAELLLRSAKANDETFIKKSGHTIARCVTRMDELVRDLLDAASMDGRQLAVSPRYASVADIIDDDINNLASIAGKKGVQFCRTADGTLEVYCDPCRCNQVLGNLIGNAIKFTEPGGSITLNAEKNHDEVQFSVKDTGCGMSTDTLSNMFGEFWQARPALKGGVGLGLAICKNIIEVSGGKIWVESEEGVGSTFFFTLPCSGPSQQEMPQHHQELMRGHLLLVDDDDTYRTAMGEFLHEHGYQVSMAVNGAAALSWLDNNSSPDLILLDLQMPVMDGATFLQHRASQPHLATIPVTVLSAAAYERNVEVMDRTYVLHKLTPLPDVLRAIATAQDCAKYH